MRIVYLESAEADLRWFKRYYTQVFPEGRKRAEAQFLHTQQLLRENPMMGHAVEEVPGVREHHVTRTPFAFVYRLRGDRIEVLRVRDKRAGPGL
jgi:plasmid stabilization system protein ParE